MVVQIPSILQGAHRQYLAVVALFVIWSLLYLNQSLHRSTEVVLSQGTHPSSRNTSVQANYELGDAIAAVFKSIKVHPTDRYYRDSKGKHFAGANGNQSTWTEPLGKRVLIVNVDTRVPTGDNQILNPSGKIDWESVPSSGTGLVSHAIANHYLYSMIHGYDYRYFQAVNMPDHHATWIKPHIVKDLLPDYDFVVVIDADAVISHPEIPLEWMFNRWGIAKHTSMALPHDTEEFVDGKSISTDSKGVPVLNSGFIIAQNNNVTFEMLEAWGNCTTQVRYPGCARWKGEWSHEQRAFSEYIRYDFGKVPGTIVGIPCDDAMGYPNFKAENEAKGNAGVSDCNGNFIRHYTLGKEQVHAGGTGTVAQALAEVLQKNLLSQQDDIIIKETEPSAVAWEEEEKAKQPWELGADDEEDGNDPYVLDLRNSTRPLTDDEWEEGISSLLESKVTK
ncbi:hypothetical protein EK21DRAFT_116816 [Setomelanomma holmii]|uniref:Nucleotide-diphospho-sugar transferase domain-containing protein n=1 Tax=Setomelanomma holmii TaxID=210430 RepID=A0A9P4LHF4_9PLEO|nr:hypothetical protein EK21DRAFT_116816 [Setomelanomma holmii]